MSAAFTTRHPVRNMIAILILCCFAWAVIEQFAGFVP
jgi:hypothetical protein